MTKPSPLDLERAYKPSVIDRFYDWVSGLSVRASVFYAVVALILIAIQLLVLGLEGGLVAEEILPIVIFNSLFTPFLLGLISLLDRQASEALRSMKPVLNLSGTDFGIYEYKLPNMPTFHPLAAGTTVLAFVIMMERFVALPVRYATLDDLPVFSVVFQIVDKSSAFLFGVFIYHTIRQLRLVNDINTSHIRISLFNLGPSRAFSRLTATTAVGLVIGVYGWLLINPELLADPVIISLAVMVTILALTVFVWPLYGVHRRIAQEKEISLGRLDAQFEAAFSKFNQSFEGGDSTQFDSLTRVIASLEIQHQRVREISTWPWDPETGRFALTAIGLPLALAAVRYFVELAMQ